MFQQNKIRNIKILPKVRRHHVSPQQQVCVGLTYWSRHGQHPEVEHLKFLDQLRLWCGELCWEKHALKYMPTTHNAPLQRSFWLLFLFGLVQQILCALSDMLS